MKANSKWLAIIAGLIVLVALFVVLRPKGSSSPQRVGPPVDLSYQFKGGLISGPKTATASLGSNVVITVTSDVADEIHVHGYDLKKELQANTPGSVSFVANAPGVFEIELENEGKLLLTLTVQQ